jgi:hypothetical protein
MEDKKMYVAVIGRKDENGQPQKRSNGENGYWTAIVGDLIDDVAAQAVRHAEESTRKHPQYTYCVFVGELTHEAKAPVKFELVEIGK